jgi:hypothetical protein
MPMEPLSNKLDWEVHESWLVVLAVGAAAGATTISASNADEAQAETLIKAMADYSAARETIAL